MDKSTHFFGSSVFGQLISLIDSAIIKKAVIRYGSPLQLPMTMFYLVNQSSEE